MIILDTGISTSDVGKLTPYSPFVWGAFAAMGFVIAYLVWKQLVAERKAYDEERKADKKEYKEQLKLLGDLEKTLLDTKGNQKMLLVHETLLRTLHDKMDWLSNRIDPPNKTTDGESV